MDPKFCCELGADRRRMSKGRTAINAILAAAIGLVFVPPSFAGTAGNTRFFADMPAARFSADQKKQHRAMLLDLLNNGHDGEQKGWASDDQRVGAEANVREAESRKGLRCREIEVRTWHISQKATNSFVACQIKDGSWKLAD
ncbi:hypothetical protein [Niveibacterium sp. SC-1]|uniref:hypothetical protein n=1 Tax=Niveibacterium sp. SC-1 TaxID=3135646 RepID=UPI00311EEE1C